MQLTQVLFKEMKLKSLFLKVAWKSFLHRRGAVLMAMISVAVSVFVLLAVEHIRHQVKTQFTQSVSGVDLIVGPRTGRVNLLMYSVFNIGSPTNNISWTSFQSLSSQSDVDWAVPISLGDSHKGFRVVGTTTEFFSRYQYGKKNSLSFLNGKTFNQTGEIVLGHKVAQALQYQLGESIVLTHGLSESSFTHHKGKPLTIVGVLAPTGTPVDSALYTSLETIELIHHQGAVTDITSLTPEQITAALVGLRSKLSIFRLQRWINNYSVEPLMAILPGVVLVELWGIVQNVERALLWVSWLVFAAAFLGIAAMLLSSMRERKQEIIILRSLGASPILNYFLLTCEALYIVIIGCIAGVSALLAVLYGLSLSGVSLVGLDFGLNILQPSSWRMLLILLVSTCLVCVIPAVKAYRLARLV